MSFRNVFAFSKDDSRILLAKSLPHFCDRVWNNRKATSLESFQCRLYESDAGWLSRMSSTSFSHQYLVAAAAVVVCAVAAAAASSSSATSSSFWRLLGDDEDPFLPSSSS